MEVGLLKGDTCNRNSCKGVIDEHEKDGSCSCHIHPPCGYCTTDTAYCPECDWSSEDEESKIKPKPAEAHYNRAMDREEKRKNELRLKMEGKKKIDKLEWIPQSHTHFSMIKKGVYPDGMTKEKVRKEVDGTFGGRFKSFGYNNFEFIAYTD